MQFMKHPSITTANDAMASRLKRPDLDIPYWHFCDNEQDANECAQLVLSGDKRATSPSLWGLEKRKEPLPKVGDLNIVTDWAGEAVCVIETTAVEIVRFCQISAAYAFEEGEGDKSLEYWKKVHWDYYRRELSEFGMLPSDEMPVVCEKFKVVYIPGSKRVQVG